MTRWYDEDQLVARDGPAAQTGLDAGPFHEAEFDVAGTDEVVHVIGVGRGERHLGSRLMVGGERDEPAGQEVLGDGEAGGQAQLITSFEA